MTLAAPQACPHAAAVAPGTRFGRLTVAGAPVFHPQPGRFPSTCWWVACRCDCGGTRDGRTAALQAGNLKSCGCLRGRRPGIPHPTPPRPPPASAPPPADFAPDPVTATAAPGFPRLVRALSDRQLGREYQRRHAYPPEQRRHLETELARRVRPHAPSL